MQMLKTVVLLSALMPAISLMLRQNKQYGSGCENGMCGCIDEPERERADAGLQDRLDVIARSGNSTDWKMPRRWKELSLEKIEKCGTCGFLKHEDSKHPDFKWTGEKNVIINANKTKARVDKLREEKPIEWKKIYYISLPEADGRRGALWGNGLNDFAQGIPVEHFEASNRDQAIQTDFYQYSDRGMAQYIQDSSDSTKWGTAAVYLSHVKLLQKIYNEDPQGEGLYLIMEDDVSFADDKSYWKQKVEQIINENKVPEDWDILKIGYWGDKRCQDFVSDEVVEAKTPDHAADGSAFYSGNTAYIVRPKSIPFILQQLKWTEVYDVDGCMMSMHQEGTNNGADGLDYHWTWGAHTYVTKDPLVFGGIGHDSQRMRQKLKHEEGDKVEAPIMLHPQHKHEASWEQRDLKEGAVIHKMSEFQIQDEKLLAMRHYP